MMTEAKLLIIHQGALGDVVLTFPATIALGQKFDRIDILCQGQIGKLAAKLGLVDKAYPLEAAYFATLFSDQVDAKINDFISSFTKIIVFAFSAELESSINQISDRPCLRIPSRPPARNRIHVSEFILQHLRQEGLIESTAAGNTVSSWHRQQAPRRAGSIDSSRIIIHPGAGSKRKRWPLDRFLKL
ncbi:MAG: hypothetical protein R3274_10910, partial [Desulfobacterales bacterium]|nr:hypothetical protein [Desulfobacterales bacterium]